MIAELLAKLNPQEKIILDNYKLSLIAKRDSLLRKFGNSPKKVYKRQIANLEKKINQLKV